MSKVSKKILSTLILLMVGLLVSAAANPALAASKVVTSKTPQNLQSAYQGETNDNKRYLAFAQKAEEEGYGEVASLFRAAARAEQIHRQNHAAVIRKMGAEPQAEIETPVVKSTKENLEDSAEKVEAYEKDMMYPAFIAEARAEDHLDAVRTFTYARAAEAQHFNLFSAALKNLDKMRGKSRSYYVCTTCGFTAEKPDHDGAEGYMLHGENYEQVN